jgi:hypothetical protein
MKKLLWLLLVTGLVEPAAYAIPLSLNGNYTVVGNVEITPSGGNPVDADFSDTSPPTSLLGSANLDATVDPTLKSTAFASAQTDNGFLSTDIELSSSNQENNFGFAAAEFSTLFTAPGGKLQLSLLFDNQAEATGTNSQVETQLHFTLSSNGPLLDEMLQVTGDDLRKQQPIERTLELAEGTFVNLDILLTSTGNVSDGGSFDLSSVSFQLDQVPEPATLLNLLAGLSLLAYGRVRCKSASQRFV